MNIKVKLDHGAICPSRAHEDDAGLDLYAPHLKTVFVPGCRYGYNPNTMENEALVGSATIDTGVHVEIPKGYVGMIKSKSGLNVTHGMTTEGVIDSGYTGSIKVKIYNHSQHEYIFRRGDKIAQLVILPIITPGIELVEELEKTERGDGGFGSTGR